MMIRKISYILLSAFLLTSCYKEDDFNPSNLVGVMSLKIEGNNALANNITKISVIAEFPSDFNTESDNKVDFTIFKDDVEKITSDIRLVETDGVNKKIAEVQISHNKVDTIKVEARILINKAEISTETEISFRRAFCESINVLSSSLIIVADSSFDEIEITTQLNREDGLVSFGTIAKTVALDTTGKEIGIFHNYQNKTDPVGKIINKFTLGNDNYIGRLFIISCSLNETNESIQDTIVIYTKN